MNMNINESEYLLDDSTPQVVQFPEERKRLYDTRKNTIPDGDNDERSSRSIGEPDQLKHSTIDLA